MSLRLSSSEVSLQLSEVLGESLASDVDTSDIVGDSEVLVSFWGFFDGVVSVDSIVSSTYTLLYGVDPGSPEKFFILI